jgi:hypothetical protein
MSKLDFNLRPLVDFDVEDPEHRRIFNQFQKTQTWGHSPYRFIVADEMHQFDLVTSIKRKMLDYYMDLEFGLLKPVESTRKEVQKVLKMVDTVPQKVV